jgi:hypothetical protein
MEMRGGCFNEDFEVFPLKIVTKHKNSLGLMQHKSNTQKTKKYKKIVRKSRSE